MNSEQSKMFRAEKSTRNRDDFKVLMMGSMFTIILMLTIPLLDRVYDTTIATRPFVEATVEIVHSPDHQKPLILYNADATQSVTGTWIASVYDHGGNRLDSRRGQGSYERPVREGGDEPKFWTWDAFFETELGIPAPKVPSRPFYVCVRYVVVSARSGVTDSTENYCSNMHHPNINQDEIRE